MEPEKVKKLLAAGHITQAEALDLNEQWARTEVSDKVDDAVMEKMDETHDPDIFLAKAMVEIENKSLAERRRVCRQMAHMADLQSGMASQTNLRFLARRWGQLAFLLRRMR
tara:strand:- start:62 stop:394 length:333 start_codon:yes stop_codon:yes gene_type:complete